MKLSAIMTRTRTSGDKPFCMIYGIIVLFLILLISCKSSKNYFVKENYNYSVFLYNKKIGISFEFYGSMRLLDSSLVEKNKIKTTIKSNPILKGKRIIGYFQTVQTPNFETILFYDETKSYTDTITKTELISNFPASNYILYKKSKANKVVYLLLKPEKIDNFNFTYIENAKMLVNKIKFNADKLDKTAYGSVFFETMENSNYLFTRKLLKSKILNQSAQQKWEQYQFLTTINSFISNNIEYDSLIAKSSTRFQTKIDSLLLNKPVISKNKVLDEITSLSKNEKVVMLNETHWLPKHRLLAYDMLDGLKKNNFNYLAIEAVALGQDSIINSNNFASKSSGYYVREPYFSHFIRKAKSLGFKIIAYDDMNGNDRELAQALNIKKIFDSDPNAKVFVYAGIAHILEYNTPKKWMAEIFKEKTGINPLTFDQTKIHAKTDSEIVLFDSKVFNNVDNLNTNVDFYIVNNLKPSLGEIYKKSVLKNITIDSKKFKNKEILIRVFNKNEYDKIGFNAIPIFITYQNSVNSKVDLRLPTGEYFISVLSDKEEKLYNDFHKVD